MDEATRREVSYFAINVRFDDSIQTITKMLPENDTNTHHETNYILSVNAVVLKIYQIKKSPLRGMVMDDASNMIKIIAKLKEAKRFGSNTTVLLIVMLAVEL